jgi:hypothetical protein
MISHGGGRKWGLGHSSVAFTLQRYGHRDAGDQRSGLARLRSQRLTRVSSAGL